MSSLCSPCLRGEPVFAPLVLTKTVAQRQLVVIACEIARTFGIRAGMTVGEAQALTGPSLESVEHEPEKDLRTLEALARWMSQRFSPTVAIEAGFPDDASSPSLPRRSGRAKSLPAVASPLFFPALLLDITGCERLFHGTHNLVRQVASALAHMRVHADIAVAATPGAAYALAFSGCDRLVVPPGKSLEKVLEQLPIESLRLQADAIRTLHHLGIDSIGQLQSLPRSALPARFGSVLLKRLDQATGRIDEPLVPVTIDPALTDGIEFDGSVPTLEIVWIAMGEILERMTAELRRRGRGARRIEVEINRPYDPPMRKTILLARPSREAKAILNVIRCAIENDDSLIPRGTGCQPVKKFIGTGWQLVPQKKDTERYQRIRWETDDGFTAIKIHMPITQRVSESQISLMRHREEAGGEEFDRLLERLHARLGDATVVKPQPAESYLPEFSCVSAGSMNAPSGGAASSVLKRSDRPTYLLPKPIEVGVIVAPSDEGDGPPISFTLGQRVHRLLHPSPLERLGCRWWAGHLKTRDYFEGEDAATGKRFWLFRVFETGRWFVHGVFD